jgi:hypothetical protein
MSRHRIVYKGPSSLAVQTATLLADAQGVELMSSEAPEPRDGMVVLALTVEGSADAIDAAVHRIQEELPAGATITVTEVP